MELGFSLVWDKATSPCSIKRDSSVSCRRPPDAVCLGRHLDSIGASQRSDCNLVTELTILSYIVNKKDGLLVACALIRYWGRKVKSSPPSHSRSRHFSHTRIFLHRCGNQIIVKIRFDAPIATWLISAGICAISCRQTRPVSPTRPHRYGGRG